MPQLFGDEGHEGVEHDEDLVDHPARDRLGFLIDLPTLAGLDQLQIPVAECAPGEVVDRIGHAVESIFLKRLVELRQRFDDFADDPFVDRQCRLRCFDTVARADAV